MKKKIQKYVFFILLFCTVLSFNFHVNAAEIRILTVNGVDSNNLYLYSSSMFWDCIKDYYIDGIKINKNNFSYRNNPSYSSLDKLITSTFSDAENDDISIFFYSGHGTKSNDGKAGIYTSDGKNYKFTHLYKKLKDIKGKKLVILDCCYSGSFITQNNIDKKIFTVITACEANTYSVYFNKLSILSVFSQKKVYITKFTDKILEGLGYYNGSLKADYDNNGSVTTNELFKYLQKKYQKTYTYNSSKFKAIPQKTGNINFSLAKKVKPKIILNKSSISLYVSDTLIIKATVTGDSQKISWKSNKPSVVSINSKGKITAKKAGSSTITATANGKTAYCNITVKNPTIKLNRKNVTIYTRGTTTVQLKSTVKGPDKKTKWTSSKPSVASVNSVGKVTAKNQGTAVITATANGKTTTCKITVKKPSTKLNKSSATIYTVGTKTIQLKATVIGSSTKITWKSSNTKAAKVDSKGKVTAIKEGYSTISATANGITALCIITVKGNGLQVKDRYVLTGIDQWYNTESSADDANDYGITYEYDTLGRLSTCHYKNYIIKFAYNAEKNQIRSIGYNFNGDVVLEAEYDYNEKGNLSTVRCINNSIGKSYYIAFALNLKIPLNLLENILLSGYTWHYEYNGDTLVQCSLYDSNNIYQKQISYSYSPDGTLSRENLHHFGISQYPYLADKKYNSNGDLYSEKYYYSFSNDHTSKGPTFFYHYDSSRNLTSIYFSTSGMSRYRNFSYSLLSEIPLTDS